MADVLEEQRRLLFEALARSGSFYANDPNAQQILGQLMAQSRGEAQPFTPEVQANMIGQQSDANAGQFAGQRDMIRRAMANAGLTGSGLEASAILSAQARAGAQTRGARRDIQTRAQLENYSAKERAQSQAMAFLANQQQAIQASSNAEAGYRSQMHATGSEADVMDVAPGQPGGGAPAAAAPAAAPAAPTPARPTNFGLANATLMAPIQQAQYWGGTQGSVGGTMGNTSGYGNLAAANAMYQQQVQQQQRDRAQLANMQSQWDTQYRR